MKRLKANRKFLIILFVLVLAAIFRITAVNLYALNEKHELYTMDEWVSLDGDFVSSASESTNGYYICVTNARVFSYEEYMKECGVPEDQLPTDIRSPVIELEVKIRNQGNTDGFLSLGWFSLLNENKTIYNYYKDAYAALKNLLLDGASGITIKPDTEMTIYLPFTMQYGAENLSILDEKSQTNVYYFTVSRYPTRKEIKVLI